MCLTLSDLKLQVRSHARRVQICRCGMPGLDTNIRGIAYLFESNIVDGLSCSDTKMQNKICESCVYGKSHRLPFPKKSSSRANGILDSVHSDVCGPMPVESMGGSRYFMTLTDDHSRWSDVLSIKNKSDVFSCFKKWKAQVKCRNNCHIRILRTDNGGECLSGIFKMHFENCGIKQELTVPHTPQQMELLQCSTERYLTLPEQC
jgi:hypothetical protein